MTVYASSIASADKIISKKGQSVTFTQVSEGTYDPATSSFTATETNYTVKAVLLPYKREAISSTDLIQQGDMKLLVQPTGAPLAKPQDKVTVNSEVWVIVNVKPLMPDGTLVLQEWQIRK